MSELEEKLSAVLSNPQLMQQIMSLAQSMGTEQKESPPDGCEPPMQTSQQFTDTGLMKTLAQVAGRSGVDNNQQELLRALSPYLSANRVQKLERAMRAARMAGTASLFLNSGGLQMLTGR